MPMLPRAPIAAPPRSVARHTRRASVCWSAARPASSSHAPPPSNRPEVENVITQRVQATDGHISAERLLPVARKAVYAGSPRNFRRALAQLTGPERTLL